jgi:thiamine pyrophosphate-dependent acetolactate synthase large subunit-like protein
MKLVAQKLRLAVGDRPTTLTNLPTAWDTDIWPFSHPLDYLGRCGGGGLGSTLSITIGAAIALRDQGKQRLPIVVVGDGDFLFGATALWTAAHYRVPGLCVVLNNRSYFNDEAHQERVAVERGRPVENRWIGLRIADPEVDLAKLASSQGVVGLGPVTKSEDLLPVFKQAVAAVEQGRFVVIDVRVEPGETPRQAALMPRAAN